MPFSSLLKLYPPVSAWKQYFTETILRQYLTFLFPAFLTQTFYLFLCENTGSVLFPRQGRNFPWTFLEQPPSFSRILNLSHYSAFFFTGNHQYPLLNKIKIIRNPSHCLPFSRYSDFAAPLKGHISYLWCTISTCYSIHFNLAFPLTNPLKLIAPKSSTTYVLPKPVGIPHSATSKWQPKHLTTPCSLKGFSLKAFSVPSLMSECVHAAQPAHPSIPMLNPNPQHGCVWRWCL